MARLYPLLGLLLIWAVAQTSGEELLSRLGPWMLRSDGTPARWLGIPFRGKTLVEPINVVLVDPVSRTRQQAISRAISEARLAGYHDEWGHSSGYWAQIGDGLYTEIPDNQPRAFSNRGFYQTNNHGRIMGPALVDGRFVFVASFSTERPSFFPSFRHLFVSFVKARDDFCAQMNLRSAYRIEGVIFLGNVLEEGEKTTGDHDGRVTILQIPAP